MAIVISGNGNDMGNNHVSNVSEQHMKYLRYTLIILLKLVGKIKCRLVYFREDLDKIDKIILNQGSIWHLMVGQQQIQ